MIHIVIGGSLAGKTTFVRKRFLKGKLALGRLDNIPVTLAPKLTLAAGNYLATTRTCGVDQLGRNYSFIHEQLGHLVASYGLEYRHIVFEGNACADMEFMERMKNSGHPVKLYLVTATAKQIQERAKAHNINYGQSIIAMSYRRAMKTFQAYKGVFEHEVVN